MGEKSNKQLETIKEQLIERLATNAPHLLGYLNDKIEWEELSPIKGEVVNCLMLGLGMSSITLTNHLLERSLKLALIYNDVGLVPLSKIEDIEAYSASNEKYDSLNLNDTIDKCFENGLISDKTKEQLHEYRKKIRNGFSHASQKKIFGDSTAKFVMGNFLTGTTSEVKNVKIAELPPFIQAHAITDFVEKHALAYFELVYDVIKTAEAIIAEKHKKP